MKKMIMLAMVMGLLASINAFADSNAEYARTIQKWTPFFSKNGATLSYEHKGDSLKSPEIYTFDSEIGYIYFYVKEEFPEKFRDMMTEELQKNEQCPGCPPVFKSPQLKNNKFGYAVRWNRIDCKQKNMERKELYYYSDTNEFIAWQQTGGDEARPFKWAADSEYSMLPFQGICESFARKWQIQTELEKYKIEKVTTINLIEANPFEFENKIIAVPVKMQRMLTRTSAFFFSGYTNLSDSTSVPDQIFISGLPKGMHFDSDPYGSRILLVLKGKGTIKGTNAFGATVMVPHFQYIAIISGKLPSVFEEQ